MSNRVDDGALVPGSPVSTPTSEALFEIKTKTRHLTKQIEINENI